MPDLPQEKAIAFKAPGGQPCNQLRSRHFSYCFTRHVPRWNFVGHERAAALVPPIFIAPSGCQLIVSSIEKWFWKLSLPPKEYGKKTSEHTQRHWFLST
jgi:hypothetical protein